MLFMTSWSGLMTAQRDSLAFRADVERIFVEAMRLFQASQFDSATVRFQKCIRDFPFHHRTTGAYIMAGKTYYRLGNYRESVRVLKNFLDLYPESGYGSDAHYTLGLDYFQMLRYDDAASEMVEAYQTSRDTTLRSRSEKLLDQVAVNYLGVGQIQLLLGNGTPDQLKMLLTVRLADKVFRMGDIKAAQDLLRPLVSLSASVRYVDDALELLRLIEEGGVFKIGVLLPLMLRSSQAALRDLGVDLLDGMKLAVEEYNEKTLPKVSLEVRDTERDPSAAARFVTELCNDDDIRVIVGPAFSNEAFAAAGIANARGVPLATPTATANGIASIGPYVFQLNPDFDVRGRAMARYAFSAGARRFAVLSPVEQIPKAMTDAFVDEVQKLGGEMIDIQWYQAGAVDLRIQLSTMRQRALEKTEYYTVNLSSKISYDGLKKILMTGVGSKFLDSLVERGITISVDTLFGVLDGKKLADSLGIFTERARLKYDSLGMPVLNIDAMFLPIVSAEEIGIVSSHIRYFNFRTDLLGNGEWNDAALLDQNRQYIDTILFPNDTFLQEKDPAYKAFAARYQKIFNRKPTANSIFGYDGVKLLLDIITKGAMHRNDIAASLANVRGFQGWHSKISLGPTRVNSFLTVFQFKNRAIRKVGEIDLVIEEPPKLN